MTDKFSPRKRSEIMSKISGKETKPEVLVRKFLFSKGLRYRKNVKELCGKPDIVLPKYKIVIFVHGCFWHGHDCKAAKLPETNNEFWANKIGGNKARDIKDTESLKELGWNVCTIWQCEIKNKQLREERFRTLINEIKENKGL